MIVLSIGTDRKIFEQGSAARARMVEYGKLVKELHIVIFTLRTMPFVAERISDNVWIYPTASKSRFLYPIDAAHLVAETMRDIRPDVVTVQDPFETGLAGWIVAKRSGLPLHVQIHTDFMSKYFRRGSMLNRVRVRIARFVLPKAAAARAVSDRIRDSLARIDKTLPARTIVLPIYSDIDKFKYAPVVHDLHAAYPRFRFVILMASRLTKEKNVPLALQVLKEIVRAHHDVGLVIVGEGPDKKYLQELALAHNLAHNVAFEPWQEDLASYYRTADVFLTTSFYEGYGLTLVEAAASGCPIISSDVGVASRIVREGKSGFVCDLSDTRKFYDALVRMIEDPKLAAELKDEARRLATVAVSQPKDQYLSKYRAMLEDVAGKAGPKRADVLKIGRYVIAGCTAAGTQIALLFLLTHFLGFWYLVSATIAFVVALAISFTLQKFWTFRHRDTGTVHVQAFVYLLIALSGLLANDGLMYLFVTVGGLHYIAGQFLSGIMIACFNYYLYARFVFKNRKA